MSKPAPKRKNKEDESLVRYPGGVSKGKSRHPRYSFVVRWQGENEKRLAKWFTNDTEAKAWAKEKSADAGELGDRFASLSENERGAVAAYRALVAKYDHPKPASLAEIVRVYSKRFEASRAGAIVAAAVPAFIAATQAEGRSKAHLAPSASDWGGSSRTTATEFCRPSPRRSCPTTSLDSGGLSCNLTPDRRLGA